MCVECGCIGYHKAGCPEREETEPEKIGDCCICGDPIEEGQDYFDIDGTMHHYDCFCDKYLVRQ